MAIKQGIFARPIVLCDMGGRMSLQSEYQNWRRCFWIFSSQSKGTIQDYSYNFNPACGNLTWRQNNKGSNLKEDFYYDNLDRLDYVKMGSTTTLDMTYDSNKGAITSKTDVGTIQYATSGKLDAISTINPATPVTPPDVQTITYTSFDKISTISENKNNATFTFGIDTENRRLLQPGGLFLQ